MDRLFWIACDERGATLYEGRFQGRTRAAAIRFLKEALGRGSLKGLVFTVTEIPVPLIREIVADILGVPRDNVGPEVVCTCTAAHLSRHASHSATGIGDGMTADRHSPATQADSHPDVKGPSKPGRTSARKVGNPGLGDDFWEEVRAYWDVCRSVKQTAINFRLSQNSVKTRARRERWRDV
jgi:hypothetical protein